MIDLGGSGVLDAFGVMEYSDPGISLAQTSQNDIRTNISNVQGGTNAEYSITLEHRRQTFKIK